MLNSVAGVQNVTFTFDQTVNYLAPALGEYSNVASLRAQSVTANGTATGAATAAVSPAVGDLLVAFIGGGNTTSLAATSPFTLRETSGTTASARLLGFADYLSTTSVSQTASFTTGGGTQDWNCILLDFAGGTSLGVCAAPTFSPVAGSYGPTQSVAISSSTSGATIRYTTDGSTPSETVGTVYSGTVSVAASETLKAIAYKSGWSDSSVSAAAYTITGVTTYSISGNCGVAGATINYT